MKKMNLSLDYSKVELTGLPPAFFEKNRQKFIANLKSKLTGLVEDSILFLKGVSEIFR